MSNYFRITAYHKRENISIIMDSNGKFDELLKFAEFVIAKGFTIIKIGREENFREGDMPIGVNVPTNEVRMRASDRGYPIINGNIIEVKGKRYEVIP